MKELCARLSFWAFLLIWSWQFVAHSAEASYEILIKGGTVIDPRNGIMGKRDVAISKGRIAAVGESLSSSTAQKVIDAAGLYVTPGLIDIHAHLYATSGFRDAWAGDNSVLPDGFSFRT